jgi:hypothetical protein
VPVSNFESLCSTLCEFTGAGIESIEPDEHGNFTLTWLWDGVRVVAVQLATDRSRAVLIAVLGVPHPDQALERWAALFTANAREQCRPSPRFARDPATGDAVLMWPCSLPELAPADAVERLVNMVELAHRCGTDLSFLPAALPAAAVLAEPASGDAASPRQRCIRIRVDDLPPSPPPLAQLMSLMDANYVMGLDATGPVAFYDAATGETVLAYADSFQPDCEASSAAAAGLVAQALRDWRSAMCALHT